MNDAIQMISGKSKKINVACNRTNMVIKQVALIVPLRLSKKENILIINLRNITNFTNAVYPECHWVISFMVYAFHRSKFLQSGVYRSTRGIA